MSESASSVSADSAAAPAPRPEAPSPSLMDRFKGDVEGEGARMSFMDHLLELRNRL